MNEAAKKVTASKENLTFLKVKIGTHFLIHTSLFASYLILMLRTSFKILCFMGPEYPTKQ